MFSSRAIVYLLGLIGLLSVGAFLPQPREPRLVRAIFDAGHAPLFGLIAVMIQRIIVERTDHTPGRPRSYVIACVTAVSVGGLSELGQYFGPRDADVLDMLRNAAGALAFLALLFVVDRVRRGFADPPAWRIVPIAGALVLLLSVAYPVISLAWATLQRNAAFPVLCDFESGWSRHFLELRSVDLDMTASPEGARTDPSGNRFHDARLAHIEFHTARYPGFTVVEVSPDWSGYEALQLEVVSQLDSAVALVLRIDDADARQEFGDRFNRQLVVRPGANTIRVPLSEIRSGPRRRALDLTRIRFVVVFANGPSQPFALYFGSIRLVE